MQRVSLAGQKDIMASCGVVSHWKNLFQPLPDKVLAPLTFTTRIIFASHQRGAIHTKPYIPSRHSNEYRLRLGCQFDHLRVSLCAAI
jgi:hypothetical protein